VELTPFADDPHDATDDELVTPHRSMARAQVGMATAAQWLPTGGWSLAFIRPMPTECCKESAVTDGRAYRAYHPVAANLLAGGLASCTASRNNYLPSTPTTPDQHQVSYVLRWVSYV
jgi:hypothetical protein